MNPHPKSVLIAFGIPFAALVIGVLVLGGSTATVFGVPAIFVFVFAMFPITSGLMALSWHLYDKDADYEEGMEPTTEGSVQ